MAAALGVLGALGACDDGTAPPLPLTGDWLAVGLSPVAVTGTTIELRLEQADTRVSGRGSYLLPTGFAADLTVEGLVSGDVVLLTLTGPTLGAEPLRYQALLQEGGRVMIGTLTYAQASDQRRFEKQR